MLVNRGTPHCFDVGWLQESLHDDAVLLGFLLEAAKLFIGSARSINLKLQTDCLKSNRNFFGNSESSLQIEISLYGDINMFSRDAHCGRN